MGTHSAWVQEIIGGCGHEVLVANPRLMEGSKRRKRKNDRIDAKKLARLGRVDPSGSDDLKPFRTTSLVRSWAAGNGRGPTSESRLDAR